MVRLVHRLAHVTSATLHVCTYGPVRASLGQVARFSSGWDMR